MNEKKQRIAIATACGTHKILVDEPNHLEVQDINGLVAVYESSGFYKPFPYIEPLDYLNDLNAMHEAWRDYFGFFSEEWVDAHRTLIKVVNQHLDPKSTEDEIYYAAAIANATAAQRAEAFIKTLNLWKDA